MGFFPNSSVMSTLAGIRSLSTYRYGSRVSVNIHINMEKCDLGDLVVGDKWTGLSISETRDLLGFSRTAVSRVYIEWSEKEKTSSEHHICRWKCLIDERGQRKKPQNGSN